jgi:hypothetical protein
MRLSVLWRVLLGCGFVALLCMAGMAVAAGPARAPRRVVAFRAVSSSRGLGVRSSHRGGGRRMRHHHRRRRPGVARHPSRRGKGAARGRVRRERRAFRRLTARGARSPLVASGTQVLLGGEQLVAARRAQLASPAVVSAREQSATQFEGLSPTMAKTVFGEDYGAVAQRPAGGPPVLSEGWRATGFPSDFAMSLDLGEGLKGVVESLQPIALEGSDGQRHGLDLSLQETQGGFEPVFGLVPVRLPARSGEGASLLGSGVSLTPVTEGGTPLGGSGAVDHAGVFYGDTEDEQAGVRDLSMFAKPTTDGFEWFDVIYSARSPEHFFFRVGLPAGDSLAQDSRGNVLVVREGETIVSFPAPQARDAEGTPVGTTVGLNGDVIEVSVPRKTGSVTYPLLLDPEGKEDTTLLPSLKPAWAKAASNEALFEISEFSDSSGQYAALLPKGATKATEWVAYRYKTQGESKIFALYTVTEERDYLTGTETLLESYAPSGARENWGLLANNGETTKFETLICAIEKVEKCAPSQGANENMVEFIKRVLAEGAGGFEDRIYAATVYISQEKPPSVTFNATSQKIQVKEPNGEVVERENVLYPGSKGWIGPHSSTAFEMTAEDLGIGVSFAVADGNTWSREVFLKNEGLCKGVQCPKTYVGKYTYYTITPGFTKPMPSGEYEIQGRAEDEAKLAGEKHVMVAWTRLRRSRSNWWGCLRATSSAKVPIRSRLTRRTAKRAKRAPVSRR